MAEQHKVPVVDKATALYSVDEHGKKIEVGQAQVRMYKGESVFRNAVLSPFETEEKMLKPTKNEWVPLDHYTALEPLLDAGWELRKKAANRQGLNGVFFLTNPNGLRWDDVFDADQEIWGKDVGRKDGLEEMIQVKHNMSIPGGWSVFDRGFFREVCTNGMVRLELNLGHVRMNWTNWDPHELLSKMLDVPHITEDMILGEPVGTARGAQKFFEFIERQYIDPDANAGLPRVAKKLSKPFTSIPAWVGLNAITQFHALADQKREVREMELMNAWTGAINQPAFEEDADDRSRVGVLNKVNALTTASADLMGVFSL